MCESLGAQSESQRLSEERHERALQLADTGKAVAVMANPKKVSAVTGSTVHLSSLSGPITSSGSSLQLHDTTSVFASPSHSLKTKKWSRQPIKQLVVCR